MLRKLRTVVLAAVVTLVGASAAQAAVITIGSFNLGSVDFGFVVIDIENSTSGDFQDFYGQAALFVDLDLRFWDDRTDAGPAADSVEALQDPAGPAPTPITRYLQGARSTADPAWLDDLQPFGGIQYAGPVPPNAEKYAALTFGLQFEGGGTPSGRVFVDLLDVAGAANCASPFCETVFIYYQTAPDEVPIPEPAALLLLAGGLATLVVRRVRRHR